MNHQELFDLLRMIDPKAQWKGHPDPMTKILEDRLARLDSIELKTGAHSSFSKGACAMELVGWLAGEKWTDRPKCASPILTTFLQNWNDALDDSGRQKLKPYLPHVIGTAGDGKDELRGWLAADWLVRVCTPTWLELAGITESATALRSLAPLRSIATVDAARPSVEEAKSKSDAARAAAWTAAWTAAGDAAWTAAGDAAWTAAWTAARDAAGDAAGTAAGDAAGDAAGTAARDAAGDAAGTAAWTAAWTAAGDAAGDAAWNAAWTAANKKLEPTKVALQASALELLDAMIDGKDTYAHQLPHGV